jgi:hypothetical protein
MIIQKLEPFAVIITGRVSDSRLMLKTILKRFVHGKKEKRRCHDELLRTRRILWGACSLHLQQT